MNVLVEKFAAGKWSTAAEAHAFVTEAGSVDHQTLLQILELLTAEGAISDRALHKSRCSLFAILSGEALSPSLFVPLVQALKQADPVLRGVLAGLIPKTNNISEHPELCALLTHQDPQVRATAAQLLAQLGGKAVTQTLRSMLKDRTFAARAEAIGVLVRISGQSALALLQEVVASGTPVDRGLALQYLGDAEFLRKEGARDPESMARFVNHPSEQIALQTITSLSQACSEDEYFDMLTPLLDSPRLNLAKAALEGLKRFSSPRVISVLQRMLRGGSDAFRLTVMNVLEAIGSDQILPALVEALSHKQNAIRNRADEVLARLSKAGKLQPSSTIIHLFKSGDLDVRRMAMALARSVQDPAKELWPELLSLLAEEDWWVRERAVDLLVEMAGSQLTSHLVPYLTNSSEIIRRYAVSLLIRLKDPSTLGVLVRLVAGDSDWWTRERAIRAITAINDPRTVPFIVDLMKREHDLRRICIQALSDMHATGAASEVAGRLTDEDPDIRLAALRCLEKIGDPSQAPSVQGLVSDSEASVRTLAMEVLAHWNVGVPAVAAPRPDALSPLDRLLVRMAEYGADDLIVLCRRKPMIKRLGKTSPLTRAVLSAHQVESLLNPLLTSAQTNQLKQLRDVDLAYEVKSGALRFRVNVFHEYGGMAAVFRLIKGELPEIEKLGLPASVTKLADLRNGLVLIGGPSGSGKSTTLAGLINYINRKESRHIISLEDPIEVKHHSVNSLVTQREIGTHTQSFNQALGATMRQDPDVILVGELRDLANISFAVTAAESGHLVFGTVHTASADLTVDRLINAFPIKQQEQVRAMLSETLRAVCCQVLLRAKDGSTRHLAMEIMTNSDAVSSLIRKGKTFQIPSVIATSREEGMQLMDTDLMRLYKEDKVAIEDVYVKARNKRDFEAFMPGDRSAGQSAAASDATKPTSSNSATGS
jgi:twitching motility protein PilT